MMKSLTNNYRPTRFAVAVGGVGLGAFANFANAAGTLADLTAAVSFTDVVTAIFAIGLLVISVDLAQIGYMKARKLIKGAH